MIVVGNWKMNGSLSLCRHFIKNLEQKEQVVICPPFIYAPWLAQELPGVAIGAQDCSAFKNGRHTGDVSCAMLREIGVRYVIVGHSERVRDYNEKLSRTIAKIDRCLENDLVPILCLEDMKSMKTMQQFSGRLIIAYEPIESIGTGAPASCDHIAAIFRFIKNHGDFLTFYGGSVSSTNIAELSEIEELDGVLVGNASLVVEEFNKIVKFAC